MKKLILGIMLLSSLCFARDIEQCDGFEKEFSSVNSKSLNFIMKSKSLQDKLTDMSISTLDIENFNLSIKEIEDLTDHIMYYHSKDLDNTQLNYIRKSKNLLIKYEQIISELKIELKKIGK